MKLFDQAMFESLYQGASESPRLRTHLNVHQSYDEPVQRLFIALEPDSYFRPHQHIAANKWEFFLIIEGVVDLLLFCAQGVVEKRLRLSAQGPCRGLEIPPNVYHCVVPTSEKAIFFEVKQGPYQAMEDKDFAQWAPAEQSEHAQAALQQLKVLKEGETFSL